MNRVPYFLRWLTAGISAVALLTGLFILKGQGQRAALPAQITASAEPTKAAQNILRLLVQITDNQGATQGAAILARTEDSQTLRIFNIDPHSVIDFGEEGIRALSQTGQTTTIDSVQAGVEVATGIPIDATLRLSRLTVAGLVDSVGGIQIDSDKGYLVSGLAETPLYVAEGMSLLSGAQAADYATFVEMGAPESDRIRRMNQVISAVFQALPTDAKRLKETLESLGASAGTNVPTDEVAKMLLDLNSNKSWPLMAARTLPTSVSDLEKAVTSTWLRIERTQTAPIGSAMPVSKFNSKEKPTTVMIIGGLAADRLKLRDQLNRSGLAFIDGGNLGLAAQTQFSSSSDLANSKLELVFTALGMDPRWQSRVNFMKNPTADVVVTLGSDFITTN